MERVIVVGCGYPDVAYSLYDLEKRNIIEWVGWLDDNPDKIGKTILGKKVVGRLSYLENDPNLRYVNTVAMSSIRRQTVIKKLSILKNSPFTLIHPSARVDLATIGLGAIIAGGVHVEPLATIGGGSLVLPNATIGHDTIIGENCFVASGVNIGGFCEIGDNVWIGAGSNIHPRCKISHNSVVSMGANIISRSSKPDMRYIAQPTLGRNY